MDFFRGSSTPNFISFCLEHQNVDEPQVQSNTTTGNPTGSLQRSVPISMPSSVPSPPPFPPIRAVLSQTAPMTADSPFSNESNNDVTTYADEMVQRMETSQGLIDDGLARHDEEGPFTDQVPAAQVTIQDPEFVRSSTPNPSNQSGAVVVSLSQLESSLSVVPRTQADLPELQVNQDRTQEVSETSFLQSEGNSSSSIIEPPPLPGRNDQTKVSGEYSDTNQTLESAGHSEIPALYGTNPFDSVPLSRGSSESGSENHDPGLPGTSRAGLAVQGEVLRDLSGRGRATLKQYFETEDPYTFPVGQRVVAFTEPQVYHLLRVLTDEAINMTCSTMEKMVIGAVSGTLATAPSRTEKFRSVARSSTPGPNQRVGSSSEGILTEYDSGSGSQADTSMLQNVSDFFNPDESDGATEMALINQAFGITASGSSPPVPQPGQSQGLSEEGTESAEKSSLDATLSEVRNRSPTQKPRQGVATAKSTRAKRGPKRGVPMREEFFSNIRWTTSFISGPTDPLHNPHMVWCHMCKKNFSIKTKGTVEILRHHRTEKHLRRDQRWRYEHLRTTDSVTGKIQHRVRGRNGKILSKSELAHELPKFIHTELIDVGERHPFYEDYLKGHTSAPVTPQSRLRTQICLVGDFVQSSGDLALLRKLWARAGNYTGYKAAFQDFDWSEDHIMVSLFNCSS